MYFNERINCKYYIVSLAVAPCGAKFFIFNLYNFDVFVLALFCANFYDISYLNLLYLWVILDFWSPLKSSWKIVFPRQFVGQSWIARDFIWKSIDDAIHKMTWETTRRIHLLKCPDIKEFSFSEPQLYLTIIMYSLIFIITNWWINANRLINVWIYACYG